MRILHVVPGLNEKWNGIAVAAKLIADGQRKDGHEADLVDAREFSSTNYKLPTTISEVWVHSMWTWRLVWMACFKVLRCRAVIGAPRLVRMTHANLDPLRYRYHGWKKRLVSPIERWIFSKTDRVVVTGEWEAKWCRQWGLKNEFQIVDLKSFFNLGVVNRCRCRKDGEPLHVLYLGRRHPLKGVQYLEQAVKELNEEKRSRSEVYSGIGNVLLRIESKLFGEEKEKVWEWCDVLCLPTLSENFGLVVAEALERGKPVITTDGAQAWEPTGKSPSMKSKSKSGIVNLHSSTSTSHFDSLIIYLRGYREGSDAERIRFLKDALEKLAKRVTDFAPMK